jgi:hypothetical protein
VLLLFTAVVGVVVADVVAAAGVAVGVAAVRRSVAAVTVRHCC